MDQEIIEAARPVNIVFGINPEMSDVINLIAEKHGADSPLSNATEIFSDENGKITAQFISRLKELSSKNSMGKLCIANYLALAERLYFKNIRDSRLTLARLYYGESKGAASLSRTPLSHTLSKLNLFNSASEIGDELGNPSTNRTQCELNQWQIRLQSVYYGWPLYAILLAAGQVLGATSFQLSLLGGTSSQKDIDLYSEDASSDIPLCW